MNNKNNCSDCGVFEGCLIACYYKNKIEQTNCPCEICLLKTICKKRCSEFMLFVRKILGVN